MEYDPALATRLPASGNLSRGNNEVDVIDLIADGDEAEVIILGDDNDDEVVLLESIPRRLHDPRTRIRQHHIRTGFLIKDGTCVEIRTMAGDRYQHQYLRVSELYREHGRVTVRGVLFVRARELGGYFLRKRNEVCKILNVARDDRRDKEEQSAIEISEKRVMAPRHLACTNAAFPRHRYYKQAYPDKATAEAEGLLVCRWEYKLVWADNRSRSQGERPVEYVAAALMAKDASRARYRVPDDERRREWRGDGRRCGSDPYTFGDMFCGGGGTSCGAQQAGFQVHVACDADYQACRTYDANFRATNLFHMDISEFVTDPAYAAALRSRIDVLHLSPPCQPYSPAHTQAGKNDDLNTAVFFACRNIIEAIRPRIFTVEETFGILHRQHAEYLSGLVHGFTDLGYSVGWKVEDLRCWGTPCRRRRFIMIGSCPGERLPTFPARTHSEAGGFVTVAQALSRIVAGRFDPLHQPQQFLFDIPRPRWNDQQPLSRTLTCGGAQGCYHPSGSRAFTIRELAALQTFPADYKLAPNINLTDAKRQIGNAFPPRAAKVLFSHVRKWLEDTDKDDDGGVVVLEDAGPPVIVIDDAEADDASDCSSVTVLEDDDCVVVDRHGHGQGHRRGHRDTDVDIETGFPVNQRHAVHEASRQRN